MPRRLHVALLVALVSLPAAAKGPSAAKAAPKVPAARGLLWEVTGQGGRAFLLGSVHAADRAMYPLPAAIERAFAQSQVLVVEADVSDARAAQTQAMALKAATLPAGRKLADTVSPETLRLASEQARRLGVDLAALERFEPWYVAIALTMVAVVREGVDPGRGIDRHFLEKAGARPVVELEGAQFQFDLFHGLDAKTQELFLRYSVEEADQIPRELPRLFDAWRRGDERALERALFDPMTGHAELRELREVLFTRRNVAMAARVAELMKQKKTLFVVVGAGHLLGPDGVPALLTAKGFAARRVDGATGTASSGGASSPAAP